VIFTWLPWYVSFASLWLVVWAGLLGGARMVRLPITGQRWTFGSCSLALAIAMMPVGHFPLARVVAGFGFVPSIPLLALLADTVLRGVRGKGWLTPLDHKLAWLWGALAGLTLYPSALGLGRFDAYSLGWGFTALGVVVAALAVWLIWRGCRFGIVLMLATAAWQGGLLESANYWDYLVDPVYCATAVIALAGTLVRGRRATAI